MQIFAGSSNLDLARKVAKLTRAKLGAVEISRFANGEIRIWVKEKKVDKKVAVLQSLNDPTDTHLVEFGLLVDALQRLGVKEIVAIIPWLGYSKQDRVFRPGEPLSVALVAKMITMGPVKKVVTFALHHPDIANHFSVPVLELSARKLFENYYQRKNLSDFVVVAPDKGSVVANMVFAKDLKLPLVTMGKSRNLITGKVAFKSISGEVRGKRVLIKDDMVVTGSTILEAAKFLKAKGARAVEVVATHHLYVPGTQSKIEESAIDQLMVTDTVATKGKAKKLKVLSVADLIAKVVGLND